MTLAIILLAVLITTWIYSVFLSWKESEGTVFEPITQSFFVEKWNVLARLVRRGWYRANLEGKTVLTWSGKKAEGAFVTVFPKAAPAFTKKDELTGLKQGPSSYFLKSISIPKKSTEKRLPKTKKVV
jgi:hypothetical protein